MGAAFYITPMDPQRLHELSRCIGEFASTLDAIPTLTPSCPITANWVRSIIRARRLRSRYFDADLFADPVWDIMLDLFAAKLEGRRVSVSSLCIAAAVPTTTALRWVKALEERGMIVRLPDERDRRRVHLELSDKSASALRECLAVVAKLTSGILV